MPATLLNQSTLTASFVPSAALMIEGEELELWFTLVVTGGAATVEWYLEYTDGAPSSNNTSWYQEVAEEDGGAGVVLMPKVVRTFADNGGSTLAIGTHKIAVPFVRRGPFARIEIRSAGGGSIVASCVAPVGTAVA